MITDATRTGIRAVLADPGPRRQPLPGFDRDYHDIVHYILRCTYRIWERRGLALIGTHYAPDARVVTPNGESRDANAVVDGTRRTLHSFPDRRLVGEDVIWCRLPGEAGYFSSHRIVSRMTHVRDSEFGRADGSIARFRTVADCYVRANRIWLEWLVRDNLTIAVQLGKDPFRIARRQAAAETPAFRRWRLGHARAILAGGRGPDESPRHPAVPPAIRAWVDARIRSIRLRDWGALEATASRKYTATLPGHRTVRSVAGVAQYWSGLVEMFPDLQVVVDRVTHLNAGNGEHRFAVRWWMAGTHRHGGRFGPASQATVLLPGVSQFLARNGVVSKEWTVCDELALLRQMAIPGGRR